RLCARAIPLPRDAGAGARSGERLHGCGDDIRSHRAPRVLPRGGRGRGAGPGARPGREVPRGGPGGGGPGFAWPVATRPRRAARGPGHGRCPLRRPALRARRLLRGVRSVPGRAGRGSGALPDPARGAAVGRGRGARSPALSRIPAMSPMPRGLALGLLLSAPSARTEASEINARLDAWRVIGPGAGGTMRRPAVSPYDSKLVVEGCDMTGAYLTRDGG